MFCRNCGKPTPDGVMICTECLAEQQGQQQNEPFSEFPQKPMQQPEQRTFTQPQFQSPYEQQPYTQPYGQQPYPPTFQQPVPTQTGNRKEGFGKALAATILSFIGFILTYVGLILAAVTISLIEEEVSGYYDPSFTEAAYGLTAMALVFALIGIAMGIVGIVMGKGGINVFHAARKANRVKPIATLVLGIIGLATGILTVVIGASSVFFGLAIFALLV